MSTKAPVKTQAKTPASPVAAHIPQPPVAAPEHEAERTDIAAQMEGASRLGHSFGALGLDGSLAPIIQRQEIPEEEEEELQLKREPAALQRQELPEEEEEEEEVQTKPANDVRRQGVGEGFQLDDKTTGRINQARGGGQPLEGALQARMSASLGHDFSRVRVHVDSEADELNQQLQATAFTTGEDIFFKGDAYDPGTSGGQELIAHELTHVVQQSIGRVSGSGSRMTVRPPGGPLELEAEEQGNQMAQRRAVANSVMAHSADILALKRRYGNLAVQWLLASRGKAGLTQRQWGALGFDMDAKTPGRKKHAQGGGQPQDLAVRGHDGARTAPRAAEIVVQRKVKCPKCGYSKPGTETGRCPICKDAFMVYEAPSSRPKDRFIWDASRAVTVGIGCAIGSTTEYIQFIRANIQKIARAAGAAKLLPEVSHRPGRESINPPPRFRVIISEPIPYGGGGAISPPGHVASQSAEGERRATLFIPGPGTFKNRPISSGKGRATPQGITGHPDVPSGRTDPWDVVLYHELVHAYFALEGIDKRIETEIGRLSPMSAPYPYGLRRAWSADALEEALVTGIIEGAKHPFSENAYRKAQKLSMRTTYKEFNLKEQETLLSGQLDQTDEPKPGLNKAIVALGFPQDMADYIVYGQGQRPEEKVSE